MLKKKKEKKANSSPAVEMSCGSIQTSAAARVISAPQVGCIDEETHNAVHPPNRAERWKKRKKKEKGA